MSSYHYLLLYALVGISCTSAQNTQPPIVNLPYQQASWEKAEATPMPAWTHKADVAPERVCGVGAAGRAFYANSTYPQELCHERAVKNLAGVFGTRVQEAIIDLEQSDGNGPDIQMAQHLEVNQDLIDAVNQQARLQKWYDVKGEGPFQQKGFTYCQACVEIAAMAHTVKLDAVDLSSVKGVPNSWDPDAPPQWLEYNGKQTGGRLCAVGYARPHFHPEETLEGVVDDIRGQLATVLHTLVSSYSESVFTESKQMISIMNVATTEAISKGAVVTHYWYDANGIGPHHEKRTTYAWGCVYPVAILQQTAQATAESHPQEEKKIQAVRKHAQSAFDQLDAEIEAREQL